MKIVVFLCLKSNCRVFVDQLSSCQLQQCLKLATTVSLLITGRVSVNGDNCLWITGRLPQNEDRNLFVDYRESASNFRQLSQCGIPIDCLKLETALSV
jgi:hypothetical protein